MMCRLHIDDLLDNSVDYTTMFTDKIDLHGLLVAEAVDATKQFVKSNVGKKKTVEVITGAGHHSANHHAAIKPAIIELCKEEKWELDSQPKNEGSFILHVPIK
jgi:hypothetical protein